MRHWGPSSRKMGAVAVLGAHPLRSKKPNRAAEDTGLWGEACVLHVIDPGPCNPLLLQEALSDCSELKAPVADPPLWSYPPGR